jgi:hypothetical protein
VAFVVALAAFGVAFYLTLAHYDASAVRLVCSGNGAINCAKVTSSPQSVILGVPVALIGLIYYAVMVGLNLPFMWRSRYRWGCPGPPARSHCGHRDGHLADLGRALDHQGDLHLVHSRSRPYLCPLHAGGDRLGGRHGGIGTVDHRRAAESRSGA